MALIGGVVAVLPAVAASGGTEGWAGQVKDSTQHARDIGLVQGFNPAPVHLNVDGSLPQTSDLPQVSTPANLPLTADELPAAYILPGGFLGIPGTALKAYHNAADIMAREQPNCHVDWALIASIGRIESNHARGGYVDQNGRTLEPILGPELNGTGGFAAIPDTDHGFYDTDTVWDRAVGPTQFIPATWREYASDGNGDGLFDPSNIYDATLATARYLCSGGLDLSNPDQERAAIYRYNNSDVYVAIVMLWADAYRKGVQLLPDSPVPIGAPIIPAIPAPPPVSVAPPPPPVTTTTPPPGSSPSGPSSPGTTPGQPSGTGSPLSPTYSPTTEPPKPPTILPTCTSSTPPDSTTTTTTPPTSPTLPPCTTSSTTTPPPGPSSAADTTTTNVAPTS